MDINDTTNKLKQQLNQIQTTNKNHKYSIYINHLIEKLMNNIEEMNELFIELNDVIDNKYTTNDLIKKIDENQIDKNVFFDIWLYHHFILPSIQRNE